jgi:hypothetical protein
MELLPPQAIYRPSSRYSTLFKDRYQIARMVRDRKLDQKEVIVVVFWTDSRQLPRYRAFMTYFTKGGLNDYYYRAF